MAALEDLYLRYVFGMQGTIPTCMGDLANSWAGALSGTLPRGLCKLRKLQKLQFQFTGGLSGTIPDCLGENQRWLSTISLEHNDLHGTIPESLCLIGDSLVALVLYENDLSGECVRRVACSGCGGGGDRRGVCARSWLGLAHAAPATS